MEYVLEANGLRKSYGRSVVLNGLDMHIPKGAIYGFVGRNGAGKTTLIRIVCGLQRPDGGSYSIYGVDGTSVGIAKSRRRMGAVVETPAIFLDMSAKDNLMQQCLVLGIPSYEGLDRLLHLVGLDGTADKKARNFSLGMRQRLGIAAALVGKPDFLVLDEPVNGLDPQGIIEMRELIIKLNREYGMTILISSHILDELSRLATHYGFIDDGRMVKEMSAQDLESRCRKRIRLEVSNTKALARVLDSLGVEYAMVDDSKADVFDEILVSKLSNALGREDCILYSLKEMDESLESFYMNLVGGGCNA